MRAFRWTVFALALGGLAGGCKCSRSGSGPAVEVIVDIDAGVRATCLEVGASPVAVDGSLGSEVRSAPIDRDGGSRFTVAVYPAQGLQGTISVTAYGFTGGGPGCEAPLSAAEKSAPAGASFDAGITSVTVYLNATCVPDAGFTCCSDQPCATGSCCVNGACVGAGLPCGGDAGSCVQGTCRTCGGFGQTCCPGAVCGGGCCDSTTGGNSCVGAGQDCADAGTVCASPSCVSCGRNGLACCSGGQCGSSEVCDAGSCMTCGSANQPCCAGGMCKSATDACGPGGLCVPCGNRSEPCCAGNQCNAGNDTCSAAGTCVACGGGGQPCCAASACGSTFVCDAGNCESCGAQSEPCCSGANCNSGSDICSPGNACVPCGNTAEPCCGASMCNGMNLCDAGSCQACGALAEPCCAGGTPCAGALVCSAAGACVTCGLTSNPCCATGNACATGCCDQTTTCVSVAVACNPTQVCAGPNLCVNCGAAYQPACPATGCIDGGCNDVGAGLCVPTGANDRDSGTSICINGAFVGCGDAGLFCCESSSCGAPLCCAGEICVTAGAQCFGGGGSACGTNQGCGGNGGLNQNCIGGQNNSSDFCSAAGTACAQQGGHCNVCGGSGEPCCVNNECFDGGCCDQNNNATCVSAGSNCSSGQGACVAGGCQGGTCGQLGEPPCGGGVACTAPRTVDNGRGKCTECGGASEFCCIGSGGTGICAEPFTCTGNGLGTCVPCGAGGQPCCFGVSCNDGGTCPGNHICP